MGNSPSFSQGEFETYDRRDIDGNGFKDDRPYKSKELADAQKTKSNEIESSNPNPLQEYANRTCGVQATTTQ